MYDNVICILWLDTLLKEMMFDVDMFYMIVKERIS